MQNGTTYIVRPRMEPRYSSLMSGRISAGSIQLLVGPASISRSEQMKVRDSTRATSDGSDSARYEFGCFSSLSFWKVPASTRCAAEPLELLVGAVGKHHPVWLSQLGDLLNPGQQPLVLGRCVVQTRNGRCGHENSPAQVIWDDPTEDEAHAPVVPGKRLTRVT